MEEWGALEMFCLLMCFLLCLITTKIISLDGYIMALDEEMGEGAVVHDAAPALDGAGDH